MDHVSRYFFVPYQVDVPKGRIGLFYGFGMVRASRVVRRVYNYQGYTSALSRHNGLVVGRIYYLVDGGAFPIRIRYVGLYLAGFEEAFGLVGAIMDVTPRYYTPLVVRIFGHLVFLFRPIAGYFLTGEAVTFSTVLV